MKLVKIRNSFFATDGLGNSRAVFEAGKHYPVTEASQQQVDRGNADLIDAPDDPEKAAATAEAAESKAEKAAAAAQAARDAAEAAAVAADIAAAVAAAQAAETPASEA